MIKKNRALIIILFLLVMSVPKAAPAQNVGGLRMPIPKITFDIDEARKPKDVALSLQILFLLTILSLAPSIIIMMTAFTRVVIVLDFIKRALSLQQMPPTQVIVGLSLFLTFFIMAPVFTQINDEALQPYLNEEISQQDAVPLALEPMRNFMFSQVGEKDLQLLVDISGAEQPESMEDIGMLTLIPAFMLSELKRAFQMGFLLFVPFLMIDMIVASILMAMGMMMLPPIIVSLPFKILLFVLVDGWSLVVSSLVQSFG